MLLSGGSLALHKPLAGSESQFFRLQNGKKSLLLLQDTSHFYLRIATATQMR